MPRRSAGVVVRGKDRARPLYSSVVITVGGFLVIPHFGVGGLSVVSCVYGRFSATGESTCPSGWSHGSGDDGTEESSNWFSNEG